MRLPTYSELETRVRTSQDLLDVDNFVVAEEMVDYFNEAIKSAESEILMLNEDYFLSNDTLTLVSGTSDYSLPADIYGQKVRSLIYKSGTKIYPITRLRDPNQFFKKDEIDYYSTNETEYQWFLKNSTAGVQAKMVLVPASFENGALVDRWYIRCANRIPKTTEAGITRAIQLATVIDIPEWSDYLVQYVKVQCLDKAKSSKKQDAINELLEKKKNMVESLSDKTPDNENQVPLDLEHYQEHN